MACVGLDVGSTKTMSVRNTGEIIRNEVCIELERPTNPHANRTIHATAIYHAPPFSVHSRTTRTIAVR